MNPPTNQTITSPEHIIDISQNRNNHNNNNNTASSSNSNYNIAQLEFSASDSSEESPSSSNQAPIQNQNNRRRSPLNSGLWISVELLVNLAQIITAIIVLSISTKEHSKTRLFGWVIGYTVGCALTLPHLYWRFVHRNRNSVESAQNTSQNNNNDNNLAESSNNNNNNNNINNSYTAVSANAGSTRSYIISTNPRVHALVDHFKMALDCFFAIWFVVGNVWIFGSRSASSDAPNLYRLCIVFLTFSCIGYAMPFILCAMICCCLPCIISIMGYREMSPENRGASQDSINALPILKFKLKRFNSNDNLNGEIDGGGILSAGTEHERIVSSEDAVCCICLAKYGDNEELRELPCMHFFHKDCVDKWLKINALCPLCKAEVPVSSTGPLGLNFGRRHSDRRVQSQI